MTQTVIYIILYLLEDDVKKLSIRDLNRNNNNMHITLRLFNGKL